MFCFLYTQVYKKWGGQKNVFHQLEHEPRQFTMAILSSDPPKNPTSKGLAKDSCRKLLPCGTHLTVPLWGRRRHVRTQWRLTRKWRGSARSAVQLTWIELLWLADPNRCHALIGWNLSRHKVSSARIVPNSQFNDCAEIIRCHGN